MFRRSKNNSYDTSQTKQRFSIKKFKFGAASVLIGISFLGGFTQGQFNISTDTVFAAEVISGSAATLNSALVKNVSGGKAYIDKYDPTGGETTVPQGTPVSDKEITDLVKIPDGSKGVPTVVGDRPDTNVPGDHKVTVEVTYPDGTKDTVEVTVHVTPKPVPDKDKYDPTG
ncbi:Rib/alpha-like domain-containing protein, partial [Streptococcus agalactiae]